MENGLCAHHLGPKKIAVSDGYSTLSLGTGQGVGNFERKNVRGEKFVGGCAPVVSEAKGGTLACLGDDPLERD